MCFNDSGGLQTVSGSAEHFNGWETFVKMFTQSEVIAMGHVEF